MKRIHLFLTFILMGTFLGLGWYWGQSTNKLAMPDKFHIDTANSVVKDSRGKKVLYWYDPMAPSQKFDRPGKSPFMDMQLVPKYATEVDATDTGLAISSQTVQNLGIRLGKVGKQNFGEILSAVGRVEPDERRLYTIQTRVPGFLEQLSVRAVGDRVSKGQKIAEIYAPEILAAQQEYLSILSFSLIDADNSLKDAARNRLKLFGMSEGEIEAITKSNKPSPRFSVYSPASGVVTELGVREGGQLIPGVSLMQLTDLSQIWLIAEVPERDAHRLKPGLIAKVELQSLPGEIFTGKVGYLYPTLNDTSRTLQVRIELPNKGNRLRPGMYANVTFTGQTHEALAIPTESVIETGKRKIVIVKGGDGYRPVEVETGQERDGGTEILKGLSEGDEVVKSGQFLIDSEASLSGVLARLSKQGENAQNHSSDKVDIKILKGHGKVVNINAKSGKITLAHEAIEELGWPAMTMGFTVKDTKQLDKLKVGDAVEFYLKTDAKEEYVIERIEKYVGNTAVMKRGAL